MISVILTLKERNFMIGDFTLQFGQHKGMPIRHIPLGYLQWLVAKPDLYEWQRKEIQKYLDTDPKDPEPIPDWLTQDSEYEEPKQEFLNRMEKILAKHIVANQAARDMLTELIEVNGMFDSCQLSRIRAVLEGAAN